MTGHVGTFHCRLYDRRRRLLRRWSVRNAAVYEGFNYLLAAGFQGGTQHATFYVGLVDGTGSPTFSANDTMLSHAGWTELTGYDEAGRQAWNGGTPGTGAILSTSESVFTITADCVIKGMLLSSDSTKGGTGGVLWSTALEGGTRSLLAGQSLGVSYTNRLIPIS